ncbi:MAG: phage holin family protein [Bacteroidetes bacterium]|nr:phage holin family protein [Bacteroidota bacterium]MCZ6901082.1 phage holin family protein [Bacteroidota bacterium]
MRELINNLSGLFKTEVELLRIDLKEDLAAVISKLLYVSLISLFCLFILTMVSLSVASYLNELYASSYLGYLTIAGFYLVLILILVILNHRFDLITTIKKFILKSFVKKEDQ